MPHAPLLAIELLSPSTRHFDLGLELARYEVARCPSYWVADPEVPAVTAWELQARRYVEVARVTGIAAFLATQPYELCPVPSELLG